MKAMVLMLALSLIPASSQGRIGETREQCIERYGKEVSEKKGSVSFFSKMEFAIAIEFWQGKADSLLFQKAVGDKQNGLTKVEISTLLEANGNGQKWRELKPQGDSRGWVTADKKLLATYDPSHRTLSIMTWERSERVEAEDAAKQKMKLDGF